MQLLGGTEARRVRGVAVTEADGLPPTLIEFPSGAIHGIGESLSVGKRLGDTSGNGAIVTGRDGIHVERNALHAARPPAA